VQPVLTPDVTPTANRPTMEENGWLGVLTDRQWKRPQSHAGEQRGEPEHTELGTPASHQNHKRLGSAEI
jgi:hypothetical protein